MHEMLCRRTENLNLAAFLWKETFAGAFGTKKVLCKEHPNTRAGVDRTYDPRRPEPTNDRRKWPHKNPQNIRTHDALGKGRFPCQMEISSIAVGGMKIDPQKSNALHQPK